LRTVRKPFDPGEFPLGAVFGGVLALGAVAGALWLRLGLPRPGCVFRAVTGVPCPSCGSTRMVEAILAFDPLSAFLLNPLVFTALAGLGVWASVSVARTLLRLPSWRVELGRGERLALRVGAVLALAGNWIYLALNN
jgi:hypothetical protein